MSLKRGSLVPVAEVVSGLDGPVKAIRDASPQARHHYTRFDQVNQLVGASEADPNLGFMARMMALCSLPRTNPGTRIRYIRQNGPTRGSHRQYHHSVKKGKATISGRLGAEMKKGTVASVRRQAGVKR